MPGQFDFTVRGKEDLIRAVEEFGVVPLFRNSVPGFSVEEHVSPRAWFSDEPGVWEWKGPVIRETGCAYGKFFEHKAAFVSREVFLDLANYRRDGYDMDARYEEGLARHRDKRLFDLVEQNGPILSRKLRQLGDYRRGGQKGFEAAMLSLQEQCYVLISDFVYQQDRFGRLYGFGVAEYSTPELFMGGDFTEKVYAREPEESRLRLLALLRRLLPDAEERLLTRLLG